MATALNPLDHQHDADLINLHSSSPVLPRTSIFSASFLLPVDNLIDTELPILEEKLQSSNNASPPRRYSLGVDIEDVLITIDDDDDDLPHVSNSPQDTLGSIDSGLADESGDFVDSSEVLSAFVKPDDVLDETEEGQSVEECLKDLDNYLRALDTSLESSRAGLERSASQRDLHTLTRNTPRRRTIGGVSLSDSWGEESVSAAPDRMSGPSAEHDASVPESCTPHQSPGSNNCCRGTVSIESAQGAERAASPLPIEAASGSAWSRSSMRRLQRLPIPSGGSVGGETPPAMALSQMEPAESSAVVRPYSAPSRMTTRTNASTQSSVRRSSTTVSREPAGGPRGGTTTRRAHSPSSSLSSVASTVNSVPTLGNNGLDQGTGPVPTRRCNRSRPRHQDMPEGESPLGHWPHSLSSMLACLSCTLGLFNISRFAILTVHFGANFIFQFVILSAVVGLPLVTLQQCLGQQLGAGVIDMWKISPLFQGVGVALLISQLFIGLYSVVGVSWMFVYFRDSFITKFDRYRWAEPYVYYRDVIKPPENGTFRLQETVADYFSGIVLQRHHLPSGNNFGTIKFQAAFNLVVIWMIIFVCLSKGLRSYGKVVYVFTLIPVFGMFIVCAKVLSLIPPDFVYVVFPETSWGEFFLNTRSWVAASQEVFLTWGLLGAAIMQIASHNKHKHFLQRDSSLIAVITFAILLLAAFLANTCVQIVRSHGYNYTPNSFEKMSTYTFLRTAKEPLPPSLASLPVRYMPHQSFIVGERVTRPGTDFTVESGYQALRFATELVPTTFALMGAEEVSPFWAVLFYFILIMFGIAQQLAIWHCVITGIMAIKAKVLKKWETTITFFSCACGFLLGLPLATEFGIYVVYFFDFTIGGVWWLIVIALLQIVAVFMIRGRPYSGDMLVNALFHPSNRSCLFSWAPTLLSFTWNVILPVALMIFCIAFFKNGHFRELFAWHTLPSMEYWPTWARQIGAALQLLPILGVPLIAVIQSYRYLNKGPTDILERIQLLYRPPLGAHLDDVTIREPATTPNSNSNAIAISEDPPPKYTPPPSYTTATGARIAKFLHQSFRRSVRRIATALGEGSSTSRPRNPLPPQPVPPPDYNTILVEMGGVRADAPISVISGRNVAQATPPLTLAQELAATVSSTSVLSVADVACLLRNSFRRSRIRGGRSSNVANHTESLSAENLVERAAPIGETSLVMEPIASNDVETKPTDNLSSVI